MKYKAYLENIHLEMIDLALDYLIENENCHACRIINKKQEPECFSIDLCKTLLFDGLKRIAEGRIYETARRTKANNLVRKKRFDQY